MAGSFKKIHYLLKRWIIQSSKKKKKRHDVSGFSWQAAIKALGNHQNLVTCQMLEIQNPDVKRKVFGNVY